MGAVETTLLIILGVLLLAILYALFIPISVQFNLIIEEKTLALLSVRAFPFKRQLYPGSPQLEKEEKSKPSHEKKPKKETPVGRKKKFDLTLLTRSDIRILLRVAGEAFKLMGRLFKAPDYYLVANLAGGVEEPDITGQIYGAYHAIRPNLPAAVKINYAPDYLAGRVNGNISCGIVVTVFGIIKEIVIFIFRLPKIKLIKLYRKLKAGRKDVK
jgi:hypothetical protein